ncbi:MAG TPA: cyclic peptide export ABC transporter [Pyrinomonadaceae bacterium]|jgi:putative ATP-binding cassette transporter|nr:cyclic peptide export ABC transporter [Pyrinomonadaceae bacterium]
MKIVAFLIKYSRATLILAVVAGVISGASNTGLLAVINAALRRNGPGMTTLLWLFVGLCILLPVTRFIAEVLLIRLGQGALVDLRMQLSGRILAAPLRHLEEIGAARLLAVLSDDVPVITNALLAIPILCINIAIVIGSLIYLGWLSWAVLLAVLFFMLLGIVTYQLPILKAMRHLRLAREDGDALFGHFRALTEGTKELKLHSRRRQAFLDGTLKTTALNFRRHNVTGMEILTAANSWGQILVFVVVGLVLFALPAVRDVSAVTLTGYTLILLYLMTPLQVIMTTLPNLSRANVSLGKVEELGLTLASKSKEMDSTGQFDSASAWESLELVNVTHSYQREGEESRFILGPINLTLTPGELVFLVGGNGSGKTTLAKLIMGLYGPEGGELLFNSVPVTDESRESYRQHFSVVFSDFFLFESLLGLDAPELDEKARRYLTLLRLENKLKIEDGVLSTTDLSQGQRKRLALLTAYLEDRPIYLFDEWAADQDPLFKEIFYYQLLPELKARGKTVVAISHDDKYYHVGDRIVKLDDGKISFDKSLASPERAPELLPVPVN